MNQYYEETFNSLLDLVNNRRVIYIDQHSDIKKSMGELLCLGDENFSLFESMVKANEASAIKIIESLAVKLLREKKDNLFELYSVDEQDKTYIAMHKAGYVPVQIIHNDLGHKTSILFSSYSNLGRYYNDFVQGRFITDALKLVIIAEPDFNAYTDLIEKVNNLNSGNGDNIVRMTIKEFWTEHFGEDEYFKLVSYINDFNIKAKEIIGFSTVVNPTETAIEKFKVSIGEELVARANKIEISEDVYASQVEIMKTNYIDRNLWKAMIGRSNFALSFITSEWHYKMYLLTENLDLSNIIAGYLKSIEQLLFEIISLSEGKGISIPSKGKIIKFEDTQQIADTTLCALENALKYNNALLDVNRYARDYMLSLVKEWRDNYRNKYFHRGTLQSKTKVSEIRDMAYELYFLILGCCKIADNQFDDLGII